MILLFKALSDVKFLNSMVMRSHICGPNEGKVSDPYIPALEFRFVSGVKRPSFQSKDLSHNFWSEFMFYFKHFICQILQIILCIVTGLSFFNSLVKEKVKSLQIRHSALSWSVLILLFSDLPAMIHPYQWAVPKLSHKISFH